MGINPGPFIIIALFVIIAVAVAIGVSVARKVKRDKQNMDLFTDNSQEEQ